MASPVERAARAYIAAWTDPDPEARRRSADACFHPRGRICMPNASIHGRDELRTAIESFFAAPTGVRARVTSVVDTHGSYFRFRSVVERPDGTPTGEFMDVGEVDADGYITSLFVFREPLRDAR